jgi:DNA-binding transcriptional regulator YdaS (Cro superfamily)
MDALKSYWKSLSAQQRDELAAACETTSGHLANVVYECRTCSEKLAIALERETKGAIRCEDLRPDVDWAYLRSTGASMPCEAIQ